MFKRSHSLATTAAAVACLLACTLTQASAQLGLGVERDLGWLEAGRNGLKGLSYINKDGNATVSGKSEREIIRGNGTRAGYVLSHGSIIPNSVSVSVGARMLRGNSDYYLDPANGALFFAEAVRRFDSIYVSYRYVEGEAGVRTNVGMPGMSMSLRGTALNFGYGISSGGGLDFTTYGLSMNSKLGGGSALTGLLYFSNPAASNDNITARTNVNQSGASRKANAETAKSDHLILQNLNVKSGSTTLRATYQDVGKAFNGFQAMKQSNQGRADILSQINTLEKEKGVKRLGFGAGLGLGKGSGLALDWDQIKDGQDNINRQSIGYTSKAFKFQFGTQEVGEKFTGFKSLRESEAAQWANERGLKRSNMALGFAGGAGMGLNFDRKTVGDKNGSLSRQAFGLDTKGFKFSMTDRSVDSKFGRIANLTDAEKTELALDIRKQFNAEAQAGEVTAKDKEQLPQESGLSRSRFSLKSDLNKGSAFTANSFSISDGNGAIDRKTFGFNAANFGVSYLDQSISSKFSRLGQMSDFERSQFHKEAGVHRTSLGMNVKLSKTSGLQFAQLGISDSLGGMSRQNLSYQAKGFDARLNLSSTDQSFNRTADLAGLNNSDRAALEADRGFKGTDITANLTSVKGLTVNTFSMSGKDALASRDKSAYRHFLSWLPGKLGTLGKLGNLGRLTYLTEGSGLLLDGKAQNVRDHSLLTFDPVLSKGLKLNFYRDTLATVAGGKNFGQITTDFLHFETDRSKTKNAMIETKRIDLGDGRYENTEEMDLNFRSSKTVAFRFNHFMLDRGKDPSADTNTLFFDWQAASNMKFAGHFGQTMTNDKNDAVSKSLSVATPLGRSFAVTGSYTEVNLKKKNVKSISDVAVGNAKPINLLGIKGAMASFNFSAINDQKRQMKENVGGKLAGMLGKHQFAMEYGGMLNEKGQAALARTLSFISDKNVKLPFHCDILYKAVNLNRGKLQLVRKYNADYKLDKKTNITYTYTSLPEVNSALTPQKSSAFSLQRPLTGGLNIAVIYTTADDMAKHTEVSKLGAMVSGQVDAMTAVQVGYSVDIASAGGSNMDAHTIRLGYDHKLDGDHFLNFSTAYTLNMNGTRNDMLANIDFKTRF